MPRIIPRVAFSIFALITTFVSQYKQKKMKLIHTADWHLGNSFHRHEREGEFTHFLRWMLETLCQQQPDALLICGDVFDSANPSARAEEMFYQFLNDATETVPDIQIVITAGNHDSAGRLEAPQALLKTHNIYVRGLIHRNEEGEIDFDEYLLPLSLRDDAEARVVCFAIPYLRSGDYPAGMSVEEGLRYFLNGLQKRFRKSPFKVLPTVACAHYYAAGADINAEEHSERLVVGGQDRVDADIMGEGFSYVALGHIHKAQQVSTNAYYAGSALPMSFSERFYHHGVKMVEIGEDGNAVVSHLEYNPLRHLLTIPAKGSATPLTIMDEIYKLPERGKKDDGEAWPYLELRVLEEQPEPNFLHEVTEALSTKAVHFCRMTRETPKTASKAQSTTESIENIRNLTPMEMAQIVFDSRYGSEMPDSLRLRFEQAEKECTDI